jgi:hypothetical protein
VPSKLEQFKKMHKWLRGLTKWVYVLLSLSLFFCFMGLFFSVFNPQMNLWLFLIWSAVSLFYTMFAIDLTWNNISDFSNQLESDYLSNLK